MHVNARQQLWVIRDCSFFNPGSNSAQNYMYPKPVKMTTITPETTNSIDDSEDWEIISKPEARPTDIESSSNSYLNFQMKIWGRTRFSLVVQSTATKRLKDMPQRKAETLKAMHGHEDSPLFKIPPEIRMYIYELLFQIPPTGQSVQLRRSSGHDRPHSVLASLLTCRKFLFEAEYMFYGMNRLLIDNSEILRSLGPRRREVITKVSVPAQSASTLYAVLQYLHEVPNLRSLQIVRWVSVNFIDPRTWAVMAPQIITEIKRMKSLQEVWITTPEARELDEHGLARKARLDEIDANICGAVQLDGRPRE